jgi:hypothetical protein
VAVTDEDTPVVIDVLANDLFSGTPEITAVTQGANGSVAINLNNTVTYTPNPDFNGADSFTYTVTSGGVTETGNVSVTIHPVDDIVDDVAATNEDTPVVIDVLANDLFSGTPEITLVTQGANGSVVINSGTTVTYTPAPDFNGMDSFTYTVTSGGVTETGNVTVTVNPVDEPPPSDPPTVIEVVVQPGLTQRSYVDRIEVHFSVDVNVPDLLADGSLLQAVTLVNLGVNADVDPDQTIELTINQFQYGHDPILDTYVLTWSLDAFAGGISSLPDGYYVLSILSGRILNGSGIELDGDNDGQPGGDFHFAFHRLLGDATGDGHVDQSDMDLVNEALGSRPTSTKWNPNADLDRNLAITTRDRQIVFLALGWSIVPPTGPSGGMLPASVSPDGSQEPIEQEPWLALAFFASSDERSRPEDLFQHPPGQAAALAFEDSTDWIGPAAIPAMDLLPSSLTETPWEAAPHEALADLLFGLDGSELY